MAKRRRAKTRTTKRRRRNAKKRIGRTVTSQWGKISKGAGVLAALSQITSVDMSASAGQPIGARAQNFGNSLIGRITGYTPFKNAAGANTPQTISLEGMFNKYTGIGLGLLGYAMIPARILPHKAKARTLGKSLFGAGLISGIFSPSGNPHSHNLISPSHSTAIVQSAGVT